MTIERAIGRFEKCLDCTDCFTCASHDEALTVAIAALKKMRSDLPLVRQMRYYATTYTSGENLGREIQGTDELLFEAAERIEWLERELEEAEQVINECEEAFSDRCHDDYAEAAISEWNKREAHRLRRATMFSSPTTAQDAAQR